MSFQKKGGDQDVELNSSSAPSQLKTVVIPNNSNIIDELAYKGVQGVGTFIIPNNIIEIYNYAFSRSSIESIQIPKRVYKIHDGIFSGCSSLKNVTLPNSIKKIPSYAFAGC